MYYAHILYMLGRTAGTISSRCENLFESIFLGDRNHHLQELSLSFLFLSVDSADHCSQNSSTVSNHGVRPTRVTVTATSP